MAKHTPGPFDIGSTILPYMTAKIRGKGGKPIAGVFGEPDGETYPVFEEAKANAALLAAAPDMLEALKRANTVLLLSDMPDGPLTEIRNEVIAAIAKAEGTQ